MPHSMTAFSRTQIQLGSKLFCWELRSVNHRYLECSFRIPESYRFLEPALRGCLKGQIHRGKLECQLKVVDLGTDGGNLHVNQVLIKELIQIAETLSTDHGIDNDLSVSHVFAHPGVLIAPPENAESYQQNIIDLFEDALLQLVAMRLTEGLALKAYIHERLDGLKQAILSVHQLTAAWAKTAREKLMARLGLLSMEVNELRIEQEIALLLTRGDISEELDRLMSHVNEVSSSLDAKACVGRRLDFLMQELNREANTLSSKSDSAPLTQHAVQMKVLIEQMREQIQNIE